MPRTSSLAKSGAVIVRAACIAGFAFRSGWQGAFLQMDIKIPILKFNPFLVLSQKKHYL